MKPETETNYTGLQNMFISSARDTFAELYAFKFTLKITSITSHIHFLQNINIFNKTLNELNTYIYFLKTNLHNIIQKEKKFFHVKYQLTLKVLKGKVKKYSLKQCLYLSMVRKNSRKLKKELFEVI